MTGAVAAVLVVAAAAVAWLGFGASASEVLRYVGYEACFVVVPGVLAFRVLGGVRASWLVVIAVGVALGYALELAAFIVTAALDVRDLFVLYPVLVVAVCIFLLRRRPGRQARHGRLPLAAAGGLAVVAVVALTYLTAGYFATAPLPEGAGPVAYFPDYPFHISLAAEAKHHWPLQDPAVAGHDLHYHTFVHMHMAAASQVTGIELSSLLLRFVPVTLLLLTVVQLGAMGRRLGGVALLAPLAAALPLLAGELDLDVERVAPFAGNLLHAMYRSPSFQLGLVLLLAVALLIFDLLEEDSPMRRGRAAALTLIMAAAAGAKAAVLPMVVGALVLVLLWCALAEGRLHRRAATLLGLTSAVFALTYLALYSGGGEGGLALGPFHMFDSTVVSELFRRPTDGLGGALLWLLATPLVLAGLLVPLAGVWWVLRERGPRLGAPRAWLLSLFVCGLGLGLLLQHPAAAQLYFLFYGYVAALPVAAEGLVIFWRRFSSRVRGPSRRLGAAAGAVLLAAIVIAVAVDAAPLGETAQQAALLAGVLVAVGLIAIVVLRRAERGAAPSLAGGVVVVLLVVVTVVDAPLDWVREPASRLARGESVYLAAKTPGLNGMDRNLLDGLRWIRANTPEDAVLAVNNHWTDSARLHPLFEYYSAFAERRIYLQSWLYSPESFELGYARVKMGARPFPERQALNDSAFREPGRLRELAGRGATHLVVDRLNGGPAPAARGLGRPLYANGSIAVFDLSR